MVQVSKNVQVIDDIITTVIVMDGVMNGLVV